MACWHSGLLETIQHTSTVTISRPVPCRKKHVQSLSRKLFLQEPIAEEYQETLVYVPTMAEYEDRCNTFLTWPRDSPLNPQNLAASGLFYTGHNDRVQCFYCGQKIERWTVQDNPLDEHYKWSPEYNCTPRKKRKREGYDQLIKQLSESQRRDDELAAETSNVLKSFFGEQSTQGKKISTTEELFCDFVLSTLNSTTAEQKERIKKGIQNVIAKELLNNESSTERTGKSIC
ncbi:baculoviral IAP repeat-containing protein 2-like isoform X1 [Paramacrobiotus metropolitanus]|uniref:baculoviral IAP repeat-containing protein 2-like isoform X1 n=1 Tax=Paramacrobiotus metropolitanus TaxID=2943436 RepID=UPI002445B125|nr:baculoviral IAP repeat-containing protein 2-like isoform X1 [Paramacrobiotus metropolitanus]